MEIITLEQLIKSKNIHYDVVDNNEISISNDDCVWFVAEGFVDIFISKADDQGQIDGHLSHIIRIEPLSIIFSEDVSKMDVNCRLSIKASSNAILYKIKIDDLKILILDAQFKNEFIKQVDSWVLKNHETTIDSTFVTPLDEAEEESDNLVKPARGYQQVYWSTFQEQITDSQHVIENKNPEIIYFPITDNSWLSNAEMISADLLTTEELLDSGYLLKSVDQFNIKTIKHHYQKFIAQDQINAQKLLEITQRDKQVTNNTLHEVAYFYKQIEEFKQIDYADDYLFSACKVIGQFLSVNFKNPKDKSYPYKNYQKNIEKICMSSNIFNRKVTLDHNWWRFDNGPLLGFWKSKNRPVALIPIGHNKYDLVDTCTSQRRRIDKTIANELSTEAYTFYRHFAAEKITLKSIYQFSMFRSYKEITHILLMAVAGGLLTLALPIVTGLVFDSVIPSADTNLLIQFVLGLAALNISAILFQLTRSYMLMRMQNKMEMSLQAAVWERLIKLPVVFFKQFTVGDLAARATGVNSIQEILTAAVLNTTLNSIFSIFTFILLFYYSPLLATVATGIVFVLMIFTFIFSYKLIRQQRQSTILSGKIDGLLRQMIDGIMKIRTTGSESYAFRKWADIYNRFTRVVFKTEKTRNVYNVFNDVFNIFGLILIYLSVAYVNQENNFTIGQFLAFNAAYGTFLTTMLGFSETIVSVLNIVPIYERIKPILETEPEITDEKQDPGIIKGNIELTNVSFRYRADSPLILKNISLTIKPGEMIAVVGGSGAGKSTLLRLLLGFEKPSDGSVHYEEMDLNQIDARLVRRQLGVVLQNGLLIPDSLLNNIIGDTDLTEDNAWAAARRVGLAEDIEKMPIGMNTMINENGSGLSGGQIQKIMIARAIVHNPKILFLDEATSALDNQTQAIVTKTINHLKITTVIIAHRLSTIKNANRIIVLDNGSIAEIGTFDELMAKGGLFSELAKRQIA